MEFFMTLFILFFILLIIFIQIRLLYFRYLKTYKSEMIAFLEKEGLQFVEFYYPKNENWQNCPFLKPKDFEVKVGVFKVNNLPITYTNKEYLILVGYDKFTTKDYWLEITTSYFKKPRLLFKENNISAFHK